MREWLKRRGSRAGNREAEPDAWISVEEIQGSVRDGLQDLATRHGFRAAQGSADDWVRTCCEGVLQTIHVSWITKYSEVQLIASLGFAYHLVEAEKLWVRFASGFIPELHYAEALPSLGTGLAALLPNGKHKEWKLPRTAPPNDALEEMRAVVERYGLPFLQRFRSGDEVFAEMERAHAAKRNPQFAAELRFSCFEFCRGEKDRAIARVEKALATLEPRKADELSRARRRAGDAMREYYRSH